jgi:hypothetical protein
MNDTQLLERLTSAYATLEAPAPSAALAEILGGGEIERDAVVVPFPAPRVRVRMRHLVAALVATFVLFSGLAVAGALPDALQREVSSVVGHLGIDLPSPASGPAGNVPHAPDTPERRPTPTSAPTTDAGGAAAAGGADASAGGTTVPAAPSPTAPGVGLGTLGAITQGVGGTTATTLAPGGDPLLPPPTVPSLPVPTPTTTVPETPPPTLPPITVPPITLPPLPIVGL